VEQEVLVLLATVLVHSSPRVPVSLILQVKRVMFGIKRQSVPNFV
jgi:hypothetical protein